VRDTHAKTHKEYALEVEAAFKISRYRPLVACCVWPHRIARRQGESERYQAFADLHNRQLLWHGSGITNFAGILSQGALLVLTAMGMLSIVQVCVLHRRKRL
jgi:poly [ADP-ribose] polymerase